MLVRVSNLIWNICWSFVACCSFMISNFKTSCEGLVKFTHLDTFMFIKLKEKQAVLNQTQYQRSFGMLNSAWFLIILVPSCYQHLPWNQGILFGAFHPKGPWKIESFKIWNVWSTGFPSAAVKAWDFPTASSNIHCGITKVSEKNVSGTENLRVAVFKAQSKVLWWSEQWQRIYIYLHWSIIIYICLWLWLTLTLLKHNTSTWPSSCRRRPLSRTPKTSRIHNLEGGVGCLRGKKNWPQ